MEGAPLNKAHLEVRRGEALLKQGKWDECIQCYKDAVSYFTEAMSKTENHIALASLNAQKEHSEKQIDLIVKKKTLYESYKKIMTEQRHNKLNMNISNIKTSVQSEEPLQNAIFRKIDEHDSLLINLVKRGNASDSESLRSYSDVDEKNISFDVIDYTNPALGCKLPKNDGTTIEELNMLSFQLKDLIQQLLVQLDDRNKEIEVLKSRIKQLENEKSKGEQKNNNSLKVVSDSSGGTSPYVYSPYSLSSPEVREADSSAPADELSNFNYDSFKTACSMSVEEQQK